MTDPLIRYFPATLRLATPDESAERALPEPDAAGRIPVALSSEFEVERYDWFSGERYNEVLDHSPAAVDLMRAKLGGGLPLISNHDTHEFRGKVEDITVDGDRKLRGWMRFSKSQAGQEARQDVLDGLLTSVSIGYRVSENFDQVEEDGGAITRTYRQWEPLELSLVPVPADPTVGAGRGHPATQPPAARVSPHTAPQGQGVTMSEKDTAPSGAAASVSMRDAEAEGRVKRLGEIASEFKVADKLPGWLANGTDVDTALRETAAAIQARLTAPVSSAAPTLDLNDHDARRFSYGRAILAAAGDPAVVPKGIDVGFEREMSQELLRINPHLAGKSFVMPSMLQRAGLDSATSTKGTELKFTQPGEFIDMLRNKTFVIQAGARVLSGLTGPVSFPKQTTAATAYWMTENSGTDVTASNLLLGTVSLALKTLMASTTISKQLILQAASGNVDAEGMVRSDFAAIFARAIDAAAINGGSGVTAAGILQNTGIGSVTLGANAGALTYAKIVDLETAVAQVNGDIGDMAYLTTPAQRGALKKLYDVNPTYGTAPIWGGVPVAKGQVPRGIVNGYDAFATNQVPTNLTKGTATTICSPLIFGDFSNIMIGEWGGFEILTDPYTLAGQGMVRVVGSQFVDVAIRQYAGFAAIQDALNP